jgi:hypothetical protein
MVRANHDNIKIRYKKEYDMMVASYFESHAVRKMFNYFLEIVRRDYFNNFVKEIRKKYHIPLRGFKPKDKIYFYPPQEFFEEGEILDDGIRVMPKDGIQSIAFKKLGEIRKEINEKVCAKYKLPTDAYCYVIEWYIYYDSINFWGDSPLEKNFGLVEVDKLENYTRKDLKNNQDDLYPIIFKISPYASKNDLIDFVKNKFIWKNRVEPLQALYKNKNIEIGKFKTKDEKIQKRDDFIFEHQDLARRELMILLSNKMGIILDYGEINKIISLENKKRKEVST